MPGPGHYHNKYWLIRLCARCMAGPAEQWEAAQLRPMRKLSTPETVGIEETVPSTEKDSLSKIMIV